MGYAYNSSNQLQAITDPATKTYVHDSRGRITSDGLRGQAYVFDLANRMSQVTGKESYLYDGHGRRARTLNSTTGSIEYFGYGADGRLLQDWSNRRNVRNGYIYLGNTLVALYEVNILNGTITPKYQHTDALGSPVLFTVAAPALPDGTPNPTVLGRQSYSPFGRPLSTQDGAGHTGHFLDVGTDLTYMQQRYYDPAAGRFLSMDPVGVDASSGGNFQRYAYANLNPLKFVDPDGRLPFPGLIDALGEELERKKREDLRNASDSLLMDTSGGGGDWSSAYTLDFNRQKPPGKTAWVREWSLYPPSAGGGWIIQEVILTWDISYPNGTSVRQPGITYFEAWQVKSQSTESFPNADRFKASDQVAGARGYVTWTAKASYFHGPRPDWLKKGGCMPWCGNPAVWGSTTAPAGLDWSKGTKPVFVQWSVTWPPQ